VLLGQNGWLYYAGEKEGELNEYRSVKPFTDAELERMRKKLEAHQAWLASRGIQFLFLIAPDKAEIYAEYLPQWLRRVGQQNRLDQLLGYLRAHSTVDILDVRPALLAAKKFQPVFYKTDTHWNEVGAFLAYQQLAEKLRDRFPNYPTESLADFELVEVDRPGGDLARLLGRQEQMHETVMHLRPRTPCRAQWLEVQVNSEGRDVRFQSVLRSSCPGGEVPRAIVFRDSFAVMLLEFLAEHVEHMTSVWSPALDAELIEREKPNVVILEFVERGLRWNNVLGETRPGFEPGICPR